MSDMSLISVIALDPGGTTGYAWGSIEAGLMTISTGQAKWRVSDLWLELHSTCPDIIVMETFKYRNRARSGLELISVELIGVVHLYEELRNSDENQHRVEVFDQTPGAVLNQYYDKRKLEKSGLWHQAMPHANDAATHLLHWYSFGPGYKYNLKGFQAYTSTLETM